MSEREAKQDAIPGHHAIDIVNNEKGYVEFIYPSPEHLARTLAWQFWALMILVAAHIFVVGYTDPLDSTQLSIQVIVIGIQIGMLVIIMLAFFVLSSQTVFIRFGRYDLYLREYALLFSTFFIELVLFIATKRIFLLGFWALTTYSAFQVFQDQIYNPRKLVR